MTEDAAKFTKEALEAEWKVRRISSGVHVVYALIGMAEVFLYRIEGNHTFEVNGAIAKAIVDAHNRTRPREKRFEVREVRDGDSTLQVARVPSAIHHPCRSKADLCDWVAINGDPNKVPVNYEIRFRLSWGYAIDVGLETEWRFQATKEADAQPLSECLIPGKGHDQSQLSFKHGSGNKPKVQPIPRDFPVQPLNPGENPPGKTTCGYCGLSWDDNLPTQWTPAPSGRCPFEYFHIHIHTHED